MEYLQTKVLDGMMEELLEEFEPMHVLDLLVRTNIVDTEGQNQIKARKSRKERVKTTRTTLQAKHYDDRWLLGFAKVLEASAWYKPLGKKLKKRTECAMKEVEDIRELYDVSEESFLCLSHLLQIARDIQESDARDLLEYFQVPHTSSNDLGKTLVKGLKIPMLRLQEACRKYNLKYLQDINAKHEMILSFPELKGNFLVRLPPSSSHKKGSLLESGTLWDSTLFPKETSIELYVFFRGEYDIHFVKLCDDTKSFCLRITSKQKLDKLLEDNKAGVFGANVAKLLYKPINGSKSTPSIRLDFSKSELEQVRKQLSTSVGYNEEQSMFDYLDMMDRLIQAINISDIDLLCEYFKIDSNSVEKIRGSNNPNRKFIHVCRQNKIWTSKDTSRLVDAVRSNKLTNLEKIIAEKNNDMSLCPEVTVKITPTKPYHATFTKFKQFMLGTKRVAKSEVEEELGMNMLFKVSTAGSLDKLKKDIESGRFLQEILTIYTDETGDNTLMILQKERNFIKLTYDDKQFEELKRHNDNEEKSGQHTFNYLDMMDRLIETMDVSDIDLLCNYFKMHHKSLERIQGSINPKREFILVCRRKKIWTNGDTLHLLEAVKSTQLTRLQNIIEEFNDMSLCPEVTLTMKSNVPSGAVAEFEEFLLSSKKLLDTKFRREFKVHLVDCEKGSFIFRLKVPSKDSLDQLMGDIHSGRLMEKLMTMYNERTKKEAITILEDVKLSINLSYDTKEVRDATNVLKQHNFTIKDQWKRALMRVQTHMEEELDPFSLMEVLTSNGTLTSTEVDELKATAKRKQRVRSFISFLETKEETAINSFLCALDRCDYYEELANALKSELKGSQSGYCSSGDMEDMTEGCQMFGEKDEVIQQCSTEEVDFDIFLDSCGNWKIVRAPTKLILEEEQMVASASTPKLIKTTKEVEMLAEEGVNYPGTTTNVGNERKDMNDHCDEFLHKTDVKNLAEGNESTILKMVATNALEALELCVRLLNEILDLPLSTNEEVFTEETIANVRQLAEAATNARKKKNYGVIGGSLAGLVGGAISIGGLFLFPFTFGTSITLIASGAAVGLAGTFVNIGFSVEKAIGDKKRFKEFKPVLEMFVDLNKHFANATVTIHLLKDFVKSKTNSDLKSKQLGNDELTQITKMNNEIMQLYQSGENHMNIHEQFLDLDGCVQNILKEMGEMLKHILNVDDIVEFAAVAKEAKNTSFDHLKKAVPESARSNTGRPTTFRVFVRRYLAADTEHQDVDMAAPLGQVGQAATKTVVGGGSVAARAALTTIDAADDLAKVGGAVAKVASGVSAASIVLSTVGIVIDLAFLGHAIKDLVQMSDDEDRRNEISSESNGAESNKTKSKEFSEQLLDLAEIMESINEIYREE